MKVVCYPCTTCWGVQTFDEAAVVLTCINDHADTDSYNLSIGLAIILIVS